MVEASDEPDSLDRTRSSPGPADAATRSFRAGTRRPDLVIPAPIGNDVRASQNKIAKDDGTLKQDDGGRDHAVPDEKSEALPPPAPPPPESGSGKESAPMKSKEQEPKPNIIVRFVTSLKVILFSTWLNVFLVFVPIGIAVEEAHVDKTIVFAMNAIAIIPLAGLLSFATETVASDLGDTIGSLMNVTFGNAVELIIFIALTKNEIPIVQASILGSILANLLLILGMCFLFGGLRFREQIYNSTVTQMSACLLSLSVMSLLLPTAFHASFDDNGQANKATTDISRGTSIILLFIYVLYLLFQLKSHAYMYQSTPQHVIDEESHPGLLHDVFDTSSSSSDSSSSSSDSSSDGSSNSNTTAKRLKKALKRKTRRRRKSSGTSTDEMSARSTVRSLSINTTRISNPGANRHPNNGAVVEEFSGDEADNEARVHGAQAVTNADATVTSRDFENEKVASSASSHSPQMRRKKSKKHRDRKGPRAKARPVDGSPPKESLETSKSVRPTAGQRGRTAVQFQDEVENVPANVTDSPKRPFNLRGLSMRDALPAMSAMPKLMSNTVFSNANPPPGPMAVTGVTPRALHRSHSLPGRLNQTTRLAQQRSINGPAQQPQPYLAPISAVDTAAETDSHELKKTISRKAAIILLICSTGLVALCAEFLVSSIDAFVANTSVSQAFVGLIIIPIVGNAAEHVCAVTVASKNKMDLAIGVAVGSSIQIALFVTPVVVLLGWMLGKNMTLYFSLFETISLFVSAFIVNFLVLDGRSNYLEGVLLIAAYIIIALAAWFYPDGDEASTISGDSNRHDNRTAMAMAMLRF